MYLSGFWLDHGATTCWEDWGTEQDKLLPSGRGHYHGSLNHAWLCGGVVEWMYGVLGGITASSPGYATVSIAPRVSKSLGPSAVRASVKTVRGTVSSNWTRHAGGRGLQLRLALPAAASATVTLPLWFGAARTAVSEGGALVWSSSSGIATAGAAGEGARARGMRAARADAEAEALVLSIGSGIYDFEVFEDKQK